MIQTTKLLLAITLCLYLTACGTDSSSGERTAKGGGFGGKPTPGVTVTTSDGSASNSAGFSLRLTDAPIDDLANVVLQFTAVEMKRKQDGWTRYTLPTPQPIDLLALHGLTTADLLVHMPIEPGEYKQLRFIVDTASMANHVILQSGGMIEMEVPKGATTGIKIKQNFTIPDDRLVNLTVDFDLRKSVKLKKKTGKYEFKAKTRLVIDEDTGFVRGSVDSAFLLDPSCSDMDADTHNAVYVYRGHDAPTDDINELSSSNNEPLTTTTIKYDGASGLYTYEAAFLPQDDYTIAFTCNADAEDLEADDDLPFFYTQNVNVMVTDTTFLKP